METWFWVLACFLSILTMVGNGFVIFLVCRRRQLRTKTNTFIVSLAVADFCVGLIAVLSPFVCNLANCNPPNIEGLLVLYIRIFIVYASGSNLLSLVLERYIAVVMKVFDFCNAPQSHSDGCYFLGNSSRSDCHSSVDRKNTKCRRNSIPCYPSY